MDDKYRKILTGERNPTKEDFLDCDHGVIDVEDFCTNKPSGRILQKITDSILRDDRYKFELEQEIPGDDLDYEFFTEDDDAE